MADVPPAARQISVPDGPAAWRRLGFDVGDEGAFEVGGIRIATGAERFEVLVEGLLSDEPDGLPLTRASTSGRIRDPSRHSHRNGARGVDHVVAFTDDLDRTLAALGDAGLELRRIREPPEAPARQGFLRLGEVILEVVETGAKPSLWGLVIVVRVFDGIGDAVGTPREAVQPGRWIAAVRRDVGLKVALAFMTPRPPRRAAR